MKNLVLILFVLLGLTTCQNDRPIIDVDHYDTSECVESAEEMKEAFFPDLPQELGDTTIDAILDSVQMTDEIFHLLEERFDSTGYTDTLQHLMEAAPRAIGRKTLYLNIHCTASREDLDLSGEWFENFFANDRGWSKNGYNVLVLLDGTAYVMEPYNLDGYTTWDEVSYGVRGRNSVSINIAYVGGVDKYMRPKDTRKVKQMRTLDQLCHEIKCAMPWIIVQGHRDNPGVNKSCPSYEVKTDYLSL